MPRRLCLYLSAGYGHRGLLRRRPVWSHHLRQRPPPDAGPTPNDLPINVGDPFTYQDLAHRTAVSVALSARNVKSRVVGT